MDPYFTNLTAEHKRVYAKFLLYMGRENNSEDQSDEDVIRYRSGDDHVEMLYEDDEVLLILSVDYCIRVLSIIRKLRWEESEMVEV